MRFVEYCDFSDVPEVRVQTVGSIYLVTPNIVRMTLVAQRPDTSEFAVVARHIWDIGDYLNVGPHWRAARTEIEREHAGHAGAPAFDRVVFGKAH